MNAKTPEAEEFDQTVSDLSEALRAAAVADAAAAAADPTDDKSRFRKIPLDKPLKRGDQVISTLTLIVPQDSGPLRGLKLAELAQLDTEAVQTLLPRITINPTITRQEAISLAPCDLLQCGSEIVDFLLTRGQKPAFPYA